MAQPQGWRNYRISVVISMLADELRRRIIMGVVCTVMPIL